MLNPLSASRWNYGTAAHLLNRAGFGGPPKEIEKLEKLGLDAAVDSLVDYEKIPDSTSNPEWAKPDPERMEKFRQFRELNQQMRSASEEERRSLDEKRRLMQRQEQRTQREHLMELRGWWLERMARGPRPLQEKLTLFWHGHFATSIQKVREAYFMWLQNETFRRLASGDWLEMLTTVTKDPAMLLWLDQVQSRKNHPNENYAREVMELFALGEGHYTEMDVTEAARAFTGLTMDRIRQVGQFRSPQHDDGVKTVLGKSGNLNWTDVLDQIVAQPQAARFITAKLWTFFVSENPSDEFLTALAAIFRKAGNNFKPFLRVLFRSEEFYAESVVRNQVKSPVQWLVGSIRMMEHELPPPLFASNLLQNLGQDLFAPPNVKGWDGGLSWITTNNLLARYNYAEMLVRGNQTVNFNANNRMVKGMEDRYNANNRKGKPVDVTKIFTAEERSNKTTLIASLEKRLLQSKLKPKQAQVLREYLDSQGTLDNQDILETIRLAMSTPEYQLT